VTAAGPAPRQGCGSGLGAGGSLNATARHTAYRATNSTPRLAAQLDSFLEQHFSYLYKNRCTISLHLQNANGLLSAPTRHRTPGTELTAPNPHHRTPPTEPPAPQQRHRAGHGSHRRTGSRRGAGTRRHGARWHPPWRDAAVNRPACSRAEPREIAMNEGSSEWAPRHALLYLIATSEFAIDREKAIVSMNRAASKGQEVHTSGTREN